MARSTPNHPPDRRRRAICVGAVLIGMALQPGVAGAQSILDRVLKDIDARAPAGMQPELFLNMAEHAAVKDPAGSILNRVDGSVRLYVTPPEIAAVAGGSLAGAPLPGGPGAAPSPLGNQPGFQEVATLVSAANNTGLIEVARSGGLVVDGYSAALGNIAAAGTDVLGAILKVGEGLAETAPGQQATSSVGSINTGGITIRIHNLIEEVR